MGGDATCPAEEVPGGAVLGLLAVEVVGEDDEEPLGGQLVTPLPRPGTTR